MESTSLVALSSQAALRRQMDVVAHNIANMNTTAYKGQMMLFTPFEVKSKGGESFIPAKIAYVRDVATVRDTTEGPLRTTGNPLDLAVRGDGYFVIRTADGERYTRNGHFRVDAGGQLVTQNGDPVLAEGGTPVFFAPTDTEINISRDGTISTPNGQLGRIMVVRFGNDQELQVGPGGLYSTDATPQPVPQTEVVQGMLEDSNVESIIEFSRMIEVQRAYEAVSHFLDREDDRMGKMVRNLVGGAQV